MVACWINAIIVAFIMRQMREGPAHHIAAREYRAKKRNGMPADASRSMAMETDRHRGPLHIGIIRERTDSVIKDSV
jgi:hypothetical protein